jgi:hypothetical protein
MAHGGAGCSATSLHKGGKKLTRAGEVEEGMGDLPA